MTYPGGKNGAGMFHKIINLMPPHDRYFELFLGSGAIIRRKRPAIENLGVDIDPAALALHLDLGAQPGFTIIRGDAFEILGSIHWTPRDLIYLDPPYMPHTRRGEQIYDHELDAEQHRRLLRAIVALPCMVMISGYWSQTYENHLKEWNSISFEVTTRGAMATEWIWFNFPRPTLLHDYSLLGDDYRQRERIKRKKRRWVAKIERMPLLERQAIAGAVMEACR